MHIAYYTLQRTSFLKALIMKKAKKYSLVFVLAVLFPALFQVSIGDCEVSVSYLYHLSNFSGTVPYMWPKIRVDNVNGEVYVVSSDGVRIFNEAGMEVYDFSHQSMLTNNYDFAVDGEGNMYVLIADYDAVNAKKFYSLNRCNYMIEPVEKIELQGLPGELAGFTPNRIFYRNGLFYLGDMSTMMIVVTDTRGHYRTNYDLAVLSGLTGEAGEDKGMSDYFVDRDGSILFTAPVLGRAYRVSPDGKAEAFGKRGSAPGRFGVPGGIVADAQGHYLVADKLRCVIILFDKNFNFITEFGYRGPRPDNIVGPSDLTIDNHDRLYVSQLAKRGVSVFQIADN